MSDHFDGVFGQDRESYSDDQDRDDYTVDDTPDPNDELCVHEAMHTAWIMVDTVDRHLGEHVTVQGHEHIKALVDEASGKLWQAYQALGRLND